MRNAPHYSVEHFPGDLVASLRSALLVAALFGALSWYGGRLYLLHTYPDHPELLPSAVLLALVDGPLLGLGAAVFTFARRIWRRERVERKRSDDLLKLALDDVKRSNGSRGT